jgi:hypothetical protein
MVSLQRRNAVFRASKKRAKEIALAYAKGRDLEPSPKRQIGKRKTLRNPIPPFQRLDAVLKNSIYKLAYNIEIASLKNKFEEFVRERDEPFCHKPRNATAIDWAIRLVDRAPRVPKSLHGIKIVDPLFEPTFSSHLATELNFAFRHAISAQFVSMFIDHVGGHEIISAMTANGGYNLNAETWVSELCDEHLINHNREQKALIKELSVRWSRKATETSPSSLGSPKDNPIILESSLASPAKQVLDDDEEW